MKPPNAHNTMVEPVTDTKPEKGKRAAREGRVKKKVYRVEKKGSALRYGPYVWYGEYGHWHSPNRPEPIEDLSAASDRWKGMVFGFASRRQINAWFTPTELRRLRRHGFVVCTYNVPAADIIYGRHQLAFKRPERPVKPLPDDDLADARDLVDADEEADARYFCLIDAESAA